MQQQDPAPLGARRPLRATERRSVADEPFWRRKTLGEMTRAEWESLCDRCGKCCLLKLHDTATGEVAYTDVACRLLDLRRCRCRHYGQRTQLVHDCIVLTPERLDRLRWMPSTCAYRLLHEGQDLPWWHPLVSGDPEAVHRAGISVRHRVLAEGEVADDDLEDRIVTWPR
jgi:uncharacterized cysteine cluster protein YcgN (CxxCxxCC family)